MDATTRTNVTKVTEGMTLQATRVTSEGARNLKWGVRHLATETVTVASVKRTKGRSYTARGTVSHYYTLTFTDGTVSYEMTHATNVIVAA